MAEDGEKRKSKPLTFAGMFNSTSSLILAFQHVVKSIWYQIIYNYLIYLLHVYIGLTALAQALDSRQAHTSFGKLPLSVEKTSEAYQFPKAKRDEAAKLFLGELTKTDNAGKNSPGPVY